MGHDVRVQELPGIGRRYDFDLGRTEDRISVVLHNDGNRDLYILAGGSDEPTAVIELDEEQARKLGAVLGGTFFEG